MRWTSIVILLRYADAAGPREKLLSAALSSAKCPVQAPASLDCLFATLFPLKEVWMSADERMSGEGVYGEITPAGMMTMIGRAIPKAAPMGDGDVFYDLGAGLGKTVMQLFLGADAPNVPSAAIAVELSQRRHEYSVGAFKDLLRLSGDKGNVLQAEGASFIAKGNQSLEAWHVKDATSERISFLKANLLDVPLEDGTVVFVNSLLFGPELRVMTYLHLQRQLPPGAIVISLKGFPGCHRGFVPVDSFDGVAATFGNAHVYVFIVAPKIPIPSAQLCPQTKDSSAVRRVESEKPNIHRLRASLVERAAATKASCETLHAAMLTHPQFGGHGKDTPCVLNDLEPWTALNASSGIAALEATNRLIALKPEPDEGSVLHVAVQRDAPVEVLQLVVGLRPGDLAALDADGQTPLFKCSLPQKAKVLIDGRAEVNLQDNQGVSPLSFVVSGGARRSDLVRLLMQSGAETEIPDLQGRTSLFRVESAVEAIALLEGGARLEAQNKQHSSVLHVWATGMHSTPLAEAVSVAKSPDRALSSKDASGRTPLHVCREPVMTKVLVERRASVEEKDTTGRTPLAWIGMQLRSSEVAAALLEGRANVNALDSEGQTPLHLVRTVDTAKVLLKGRADLFAKDPGGRTALHSMSAGGRVDVAREVLAQQVDKKSVVDIKDSQGRTPLSICRDASFATALLNARAEVSVTDSRERTPLHNLVFAPETGEGHPMLKLLLAHGGDKALNQPDAGGYPPWFHATRRGDMELLELLITSRSDIHFVDSRYERTGLHVAAEAGHRAMAKYLLQLGAEVNVVDGLGMSPQEAAVSAEMAALLAPRPGVSGLGQKVVSQPAGAGEIGGGVAVAKSSWGACAALLSLLLAVLCGARRGKAVATKDQ